MQNWKGYKSAAYWNEHQTEIETRNLDYKNLQDFLLINKLMIKSKSTTRLERLQLDKEMITQQGVC